MGQVAEPLWCIDQRGFDIQQPGDAAFQGGGRMVSEGRISSKFTAVDHRPALRVHGATRGSQVVQRAFVFIAMFFIVANASAEPMFGFSNGAIGRFGPPSFEQAVFRFEGAEATIEIELR